MQNILAIYSKQITKIFGLRTFLEHGSIKYDNCPPKIDS
jgi:hypothetical protein